MKFTFGEDNDHKIDRLAEWHLFFALLPKKMGVDTRGRNKYVWLETIERKGKRLKCKVGYVWLWWYREVL